MANSSPCGVCMRKIKINYNTKICTNCKFPLHLKCSKMSRKEYSDLNAVHFCTNCIIKNVPFSTLSNNEFYLSVIKCAKTPLDYTSDFDFLPSPTQQKLFNKLNDIINQNNITHDDSDEDANQPLIDCNYYNINDFTDAKFNASKSFSILHLNIHSIQFHIEDLRIILQMLNFNFDVIANL